MSAGEVRRLALMVDDLRTNGGACGFFWLAHAVADALEIRDCDRAAFLTACGVRS